MTAKLENIALALEFVRRAKIVLDLMIREMPPIASHRDIEIARTRLTEARSLMDKSLMAI